MVFTPKGGTMNYQTDHFNQQNQPCDIGPGDLPGSRTAVSVASRPDEQEPRIRKPTFKQFLYSLRNPSSGEWKLPSSIDPMTASRGA